MNGMVAYSGAGVGSIAYNIVVYNQWCHVIDVSSCSLAVSSLEMRPFFSHSAFHLGQVTHSGDARQSPRVVSSVPYVGC